MLRKLAEHDQADAIDVGLRGATHARNIAAADLAARALHRAASGLRHQVADPIVPVPPIAYGCMTHPVTLQAVDKWFAHAERDLWPLRTPGMVARR